MLVLMFSLNQVSETATRPAASSQSSQSINRSINRSIDRSIGAAMIMIRTEVTEQLSAFLLPLLVPITRNSRRRLVVVDACEPVATRNAAQLPGSK